MEYGCRLVCAAFFVSFEWRALYPGKSDDSNASAYVLSDGVLSGKAEESKLFMEWVHSLFADLCMYLGRKKADTHTSVSEVAVIGCGGNAYLLYSGRQKEKHIRYHGFCNCLFILV